MGSGCSAKSKYTPVVELKGVGQGSALAEAMAAAASKSSTAGAGDPPPDTKESLRVGMTVRLKGLKACPELNGTSASVVKFDPANGRWTVRLESGEEKAIKVENVVIETVKVGGYVRLTGLQKEASLNGMIGTVESYDAAAGRWTVKLSGGVKKALKAQNLVALVNTSAKTPAPARDERAEAEERMETSGPFNDVEDSPLLLALRCGHIRLARGSYFRRRFKEGAAWQRRQDIDESDLWPLEQAASMWAEWRSNFFIAVSYPWLARDHSDPESFHLQRLAYVLRHWCHPPLLLHGSTITPNQEVAGPPDVGVFLDFTCLHQQQKGGLTREEALYQSALDSMGYVYGHEHTTVWRFTNVPAGMPRKYHHRGWTCFESCLAANKAFQDDKVFSFSDTFDPTNEATRQAGFWRKYRQTASPPCSPERFAELLWGCEQEVKNVWAPFNKVFAEPADKNIVVAKFREAWDEQRRVRELDFKSVGWGDTEAMQLAALLPSFCNLEALRLTGNRIGDVGAEAVLGALFTSPLRILDLGDNCIGARGANAMCAALPSASKLVFLFAFANPFTSEDTARWQLTTAWGAAGKEKQGLILDHFALNAK